MEVLILILICQLLLIQHIVFLFNNVCIDVLSNDVQITKCGGLFSDRQRDVEISRGNRSCVFYSMASRQGNLVMVHGMSVSKDDNVIMTVNEFSSIQFRNVYLTKIFSQSVKFNSLDLTPELFALYKIPLIM